MASRRGPIDRAHGVGGGKRPHEPPPFRGRDHAHERINWVMDVGAQFIAPCDEDRPPGGRNELRPISVKLSRAPRRFVRGARYSHEWSAEEWNSLRVHSQR